MSMNIQMKYMKSAYLLILPLLFIASLILNPLEHYFSGHFDAVSYTHLRAHET